MAPVRRLTSKYLAPATFVALGIVFTAVASTLAFGGPGARIVDAIAGSGNSAGSSVHEPRATPPTSDGQTPASPRPPRAFSNPRGWRLGRRSHVNSGARDYTGAD